ncbi:MAG: regulatory iron-sulfur-containing complex subunit RicT [Bacteroidales bacterium]|nr:regulatory iron-sulfur-containing complex subunit RicT [Bacteroidales bacterium]
MNNTDNKDNSQGETTNCNKCKSANFDKLNIYNWLEDIPRSTQKSDIIEVRFKNTRKEYFRNVNELRLTVGDIVAVEASPGHDIGIVSLTGELINLQLKKNNVSLKHEELKKIYRKAKSTDIEKWKEAISLEKKTMLKARKLAKELKLDMKIGDVEYQGDITKGIFYYIASERVDFRELIKVLAEQFKIRIEMRQIGARQEAGRIGGIGSCGRELCCSTWMSNFVSVTTNSARDQEISLNPQKLAGQCGKLKCCLNHELDCYLDAKKKFPNTEIALETMQGTASYFKTDILRGIMWYSFKNELSANISPVPVERVKEIIKLNEKGQKPDLLIDTSGIINTEKNLDYDNVVGQESLTRFDKKTTKPKLKKKKNKRRKNHDKK